MDTKQLLEAVETIRVVKGLFDIKNNEWLPVMAAIGGAFVGGITTIIPNYFIELKKRRDERKSVTSALLAEVSALLTVVEYRGYFVDMKKVSEALRASPRSTYKYSVNIPNHYSRVYQGHIERLGAIDPDIAAKIIEFHQLIDAIVQDIIPGGVIAEQGGDLEAFEQLVVISERAAKLGKEITLH